MSEVDTYIKENAEVHQFAAEVARIISGIPQMPEFSSESMSVSDASQLIGLPVTAIRAGIVYGWLPIGVATRNNKPVRSMDEMSSNWNRSVTSRNGITSSRSQLQD